MQERVLRHINVKLGIFIKNVKFRRAATYRNIQTSRESKQFAYVLLFISSNFHSYNTRRNVHTINRQHDFLGAFGIGCGVYGVYGYLRLFTRKQYGKKG